MDACFRSKFIERYTVRAEPLPVLLLYGGGARCFGKVIGLTPLEYRRLRQSPPE